MLQDGDGLTLLEHTLPDADVHYPDLAPIFPAANRMQRAAFDLVGIPSDADDQRPWLWLASWPIDQFPLRRDFEASPKWEPGQEDYAFVQVAGDGVHEIPVGPCTRASSSPAISASRSSARRCCAWRSASATRTRASKSASRR